MGISVKTLGFYPKTQRKLIYSASPLSSIAENKSKEKVCFNKNYFNLPVASPESSLTRDTPAEGWTLLEAAGGTKSQMSSMSSSKLL